MTPARLQRTAAHRPQIGELGGKQPCDLADFAGIQLGGHDFQDGLSDAPRIRRRIVAKACMNAVQELLAMLLFGLVRRTPTLVVNAADEHGQLGAQMRGFIDRKPVAQGLHYGSQGEVCALRLVPIQGAHDFS
ncbi:MAG TPA: hypothetical protein VKV17_07335 [Bryobacteraceae bacterium]|nr:hypothetical protein [Bryobacteraceae bacterium]